MGTLKRMHEDMIEIDAAVVRRLVAAQFPRWAELSITPVASAGTDNALFRLGSELSARLPKRHATHTQIERDHAWLPPLAPLLPLAVPEPVAIGEPDGGYPCRWAVHRWIEGAAVSDTPHVDLDHAAAALGRFVVALRDADVDGPPSRRTTLGRGDDVVREGIAQLRPGDLPADVEPVEIAAAWSRAVAAPAWTGPPRWVHADLLPSNVLARDGRVTAVIDFGCAGMSDPACDLMPAWTVLTAATRPAFRAVAGIDDAAWERGRGWALQFVRGISLYRDTNLAFVALARRAVVEAVRDARTT